MGRFERIVFAITAAILVVLRCIAFLHYRFDSDEAQHLHVTWGWTAGLVQYRDVFDNHTPLFHMATAPVLALLGERPDILLWMRAPMVPLFALVVVCTYVLGRRLYSHRGGLWSALLLVAFPPYFLKSIEYRTDNLWTAVCMIVFVVVAGRPYTPRRAFATGLLLGIALAISMKTIPLAISLFAATAVRRVLHGDRAEVVRPLLATAAGFLIVPSALVAWFAERGVWNELVYCVVTFNRKVAETRRLEQLGWVLFPLLVLAIVLIARRYRQTPSARLFCALLAAFYVAIMIGFWMMISPRDLLPVMPLLAIFAAAAIDARRWRVPAFATLLSMCALSLYYYADRFENRTDEHITMMRQALGLTRPGEPIMDLKGETIYRPRPFYYAFEAITRAQMKAGLIRDTVPEDIVRARCYVTQADGPMFPPRANAFIHRYYLDMGRLRAAGQLVADDGTFTIVVPGRYVAITQRGAIAEPRDFPAGTHVFERKPGEAVAILWAPAFERGYSPFHLRDREF